MNETKIKKSILRKREIWLKSSSVKGYLYVSNDNDDVVLPQSEHFCKTTLTEISSSVTEKVTNNYD